MAKPIKHKPTLRLYNLMREHGIEHKDIAEHLGIKRPAVGMRLQRGQRTDEMEQAVRELIAARAEAGV